MRNQAVSHIENHFYFQLLRRGSGGGRGWPSQQQKTTQTTKSPLRAFDGPTSCETVARQLGRNVLVVIWNGTLELLGLKCHAACICVESDGVTLPRSPSACSYGALLCRSMVESPLLATAGQFGPWRAALRSNSLYCIALHCFCVPKCLYFPKSDCCLDSSLVVALSGF